MKNKLILFAVAGICVVAAVIGLVGTDVVHHKLYPEDGEKDPLATTTKPVATICGPTDYKEACVNSLNSLANNQSATPKDYYLAALQSTLQEVKTALEKSATIGKSVTEKSQKLAVEECKDLLKFAVDELQASLSTVGDSDLHTMSDRKAELMNWLSAVVSYQDTCLDACEVNPDLKESMSNDLMNATQLTSNALAIVSTMSDILKSFDIPEDKNVTSRRLLNTNNGYPEWLSNGDRKLLAAKNAQIRPDAVVAKDGSGQFKTIAAALAAYPKNKPGRYTIYVKAGIYDEYITVTKDQVNVFMYGDGPRKTIVTGRKCNTQGVPTMQTASFAAVGTGFIAKSMGFQNTAGPQGHQAVALRSQSDMSAFYNVRIDGYQDSLYTQTHRQFYRNCVISGTVDFIFGDATVVIQNSLIIVRQPMPNQQNTITAQGKTNRFETTGIVIQNCRIVPEQKLYPTRFQTPTFLGRPWKEFSTTVIMESMMGDFIQPVGWMPWQGTFALDTLFYREFNNRGPGANTAQRVKWRGYKVMTNRNEATPFTAGPFLQGDQWIPKTGAPFVLGLTR
ncbi:putative pectinesterase/pectinesterase inhibitor 13 [Apium graveolens]|uniref:putative pectinesterase/pectinesterase inhibitor 13 n=1 Tax=Apium graveolens TaxID=4045 RepID=UPI003D7A3939